MRAIIKYFHHLFNPHCDHCDHDKACKNCEVLQQLLTEERFEKKRLLDTLLSVTNPVAKPEPDRTVAFEDIRPKHTPWRVKKEMLEAEDRRHAALLKAEYDKSIEKLEHELEIPNAQSTGT